MTAFLNYSSRRNDRSSKLNGAMTQQAIVPDIRRVVSNHHGIQFGVCYFVIFVICTFSNLVAAEVFRWVDSEGNVHFSDQPPPSSNPKKINLNAVNTDDSRESREKLNQVFAGETQAEKQQRLQQQALNKQRQAEQDKHCTKAKKELDKIQGPVTFVDNQGNPVEVSERERQRRAAQFAREVQKYCG